MSAASSTAAQGAAPPQHRLPRPLRIWRALRDPLGYLTFLEAQFGDIVSVRPDRFYAVFRPEFVKHILQDNHPNYEKGARYRAALAPLMGNGLFTSEGAFWLRQRRLAQGAFQSAHLASFSGPIPGCVSEMADEWSQKARQGQPVPLREDLTVLTLRIAMRNLFGTDADREMPSLLDAVYGVNEEMHLAESFLPVQIPKWVQTPGRRRFARSLATIDDFVFRVIAMRRQRAEPGSDLIGLLTSARDPQTGEQMDPRQLRDELVTMLNAGHDTITDSLVWTLVLLARHPEAMAQARAEVARFAGSAPPTVEAVRNMEFVGRVFHEALRLYPPGWAFARTAIEDDTIGGYRIPAGALMIISPYVVHRSPRYWQNPDVFDPDRFLPAASAARPKFTYFPFGSGPRQCIGAGMVMMEAPLILACLLQRFEFSLPDDAAILPSPRVSLRPKGVVYLKVRPV